MKKIFPAILALMMIASFPFVLSSDDTYADTCEEIPSSYDMRDHYVMPGVRDQGNYGTCYAFSAIGMVESALYRDGLYWDLSELYLASTLYFDDGTGSYRQICLDPENAYFEGGYDGNCLQRLSSGFGSALEEDVPYSDCSKDYTAPQRDPLLFVDGYTCFDMDKDADEIKQRIMSGQQIGFGFAVEDVFPLPYAKDGKYYYVFTPSEKTFNHGVTLVGWDDDFDSYYFGNSKLPRGAWLIKNSWGEGGFFVGCGYYWVPYYTTVEMDAYAVDSYILVDSGTHLYSYDPVPGNMTVAADTAANMFRADGNETLTEVSFESYMRDFDYTVRVFTGCTPGYPVSGTLGSEVSGHSCCGGLIKVVLDGSVNLYSGQYFSVVISFEGEDPSICVEESGEMIYDRTIGAELEARAVSESGQSFVLRNGTWEDISSSGHTNVRFKAYTADADTAAPENEVSVFTAVFAVGAGVCIPAGALSRRKEV